MDEKLRDAKLVIGDIELNSVAAIVRGRPALEQWAGPLLFALWVQRASPWWIGDLLNQGDAHFGEMFSQICEGQISGELLQRYESVARRVPPENRRPNLSWSAHAAVARLPHDRQRAMLQKAEQFGWSSEVLRVKAREALKDHGTSSEGET